jgi:hypothetical protein
MRRLLAVVLVVLAAALLMVACGEDTTLPPDGPHPQTFQNLSEKWHVLNNFELAHNKRVIYRYDELLDDNYTFFFDTVQNHAVVTIQWGRETDVPATAALLANVSSIDFDLVDLQKVTWTEKTATDNSNEKWYVGVRFYHFTVKIGSTTYTGVESGQLSFTVRNSGTVDTPRWKLVELRDLAQVTAPPATAAGMLQHTDRTTYGQMKSSGLP